MTDRTARYASTLRDMIRLETVSGREDLPAEQFHVFRERLKELFPALFGKGEYTEFDHGFTLKWEGSDPSLPPVLFLNHHDVVEAGGKWRYPPFSGEVAEDKLWGRGTLDDKGGLWAMLQAGDELIAEGFVPSRTVWFASASTEESTGEGADAISRWFEEQGIRFLLCLDEGGFIIQEPISGAKGWFAMIGVGEKGCADLRFTARSHGGHASMPARNTPLVRLGRFMAEADSQRIFPARMHPAVMEMLRCLAPYIDGVEGRLLAEPQRHRVMLTRALQNMSPKAAALLRTTMAFTMAHGSEGRNVIPSEAWVVANMRYSHHQGQEGSFEAARKLAAKYDLEMEVLDPGNPSRIADFRGEGYRRVKAAIEAVFPDVTPVPYLMTGASDSRFFDRVCDQCIRFLPLAVSDEQTASIHGVNENVDLKSLEPAVDFYRTMMKEM